MKTGNGIGFLGVLFIVFLVLKLTNQIDWSWWWVTCPFWGPTAIGVVVWICLVLWSRVFVWYKLRTDEGFRKTYELLKKRQENIKQQPRTLADRLKQMQEEAQKLERQNK